MNETQLMQAILSEFGARPDLRIWRANVLVARTGTGRVVRAGVKGQADISGIRLPTGQRVEIEVKSRTGRQTKQQRAWQRMIERFGGLYILAASLDDVRRALPVSPFSTETNA
jgi:hypothetical protein